MVITLYAEILSPSKIDMYLACPARYYHKVEAGTRELPSKAFLVGSCFHDAAEKMTKSKYTMDLKEAMIWCIANKKAYSRAVQLEALRIGEKWLATGPLPPIHKVIAVEESFGPPGSTIRGKPVHTGITFDSGLKLRGIIDIVWEDADNTIVVGDYKTQWSPITDEDLAAKTQAMAYALAMHKVTKGSRNIRVEFYMIRWPEGGPVVWAPLEEDYAEMEEYLRAVQLRIQKDTTHLALPSLDCRWCDFNYTCPEFLHWAGAKPPDKSIWHTMETDELAQEYDVWNARMLATKRVNDQLKDILVEVMSRDNLRKIGNFQLDRKVKRQWDEEGEAMLKKYGGELPPFLAIEMSSHQRVTYGKPFLRRIGGRGRMKT